MKLFGWKGQVPDWINGSVLCKLQCLPMKYPASSWWCFERRESRYLRKRGTRMTSHHSFPEKTHGWLRQKLFRINHVYKLTCHDDRHKLIVADVHWTQKTDNVKKTFKAVNITVALISPGCTSLPQPLVVAVFSVVKIKLEIIQNKHMLDNLDLYANSSFTAGYRHALITKWIAEAWGKFCTNQEGICCSFVKTSIALPVEQMMTIYCTFGGAGGIGIPR